VKKTLLALMGIGIAASVSGDVLGPGAVVLENAVNSSGWVSLNGPYNGQNGAAAGTYQVALLWFNGSSFQQIGAVYQTAASKGDGTGYFYGETVNIPVYAPTGTFEVEGWTGNYANYASAVANGNGVTTFAGLTQSFTSPEANETTVPPRPPVYLSVNPGQQGQGNWDGNLILQIVPEPSTIALGGLGAVAFWMFRRRK
jgi:hypothetical protein